METCNTRKLDVDDPEKKKSDLIKLVKLLGLIFYYKYYRQQLIL